MSSFGFVIFPSFHSSSFLFFSLSSSVSCVSICSFTSIPPNNLKDISIVSFASTLMEEQFSTCSEHGPRIQTITKRCKCSEENSVMCDVRCIEESIVVCSIALDTYTRAHLLISSIRVVLPGCCHGVVWCVAYEPDEGASKG